MNGNCSYYPPRARWHSRLRSRWSRKIAAIDAHTCHARLNLTALLIPGVPFRAYRISVGNAITAAYAIGLLLFFVFLGQNVGNWIFSCLLGAHVSSISYLIKRLAPESSLTFRIAATIGTLLFVSAAFYIPIRQQLEQHICMPMRIDNCVIIIGPSAAKNIKRGNWIAYRIDGAHRWWENGNYHGSVYIADGIGLDRVLAVAGDTVHFEGTNFWINGRICQSQAYMPKHGEFVVPKGCWFLWPTLTVSGNTIAQEEISRLYQAQSIVSEENLVGKPFEHWFLRRQLIP